MYVGWCEIRLGANGFKYVVNGHIKAGYGIIVNALGIDDYDRLAVDEFSHFDRVLDNLGDDIFEYQQGENRNKSIHDWHLGIRHWYAGKLSDNKRYCELEWLQFSKLFFAHQSHCDEQEKIYEHGSYKNY